MPEKSEALRRIDEMKKAHEQVQLENDAYMGRRLLEYISNAHRSESGEFTPEDVTFYGRKLTLKLQ